MQTISWADFEQVELRVGRITKAEPFPQARKAAYILHTELYALDELVGRLVVAVVNFPAKQIGPVKSECLVTGFPDEAGNVVLCVPDKPVPLGGKLF